MRVSLGVPLRLPKALHQYVIREDTMMTLRLPLVVTVLAALAAGSWAGEPSDLTVSSHFGGGYCASIPKEWLGLFFFSTRPDAVGFYADLKAGFPALFLLSATEEFCDSITVDQAEAWGIKPIDERDEWFSANVGLTRVVSSSVVVYFGLGYSIARDYHKYPGLSGPYISEDECWTEAGTTRSLNVLGGVLMPLSSDLGVRLGGELSPLGVGVGVFYVN